MVATQPGNTTPTHPQHCSTEDSTAHRIADGTQDSWVQTLSLTGHRRVLLELVPFVVQETATVGIYHQSTTTLVSFVLLVPKTLNW